MFAGFSLMQSEAFVGLAAEISLVAYVLYRALPGAIKISNAFNGIYFSRDCLTTVVAFFEKFNSLKKPGKTARHVRLPSFGGINFQGKKFTYNGEPVVHVKGNSGSGKTSMLMALTGIKDQENFEVFDENGRPAVGLTGGVYLFQKSVLFQGSVEDNLLLPKSSSRDLAEELLVRFKLCGEDEAPLFMNRMVGSNNFGLSGGQVQRICLARALLQDPEFLVLDEALSGIDIRLEEELVKFLAQDLRIPIFYVSHKSECPVAGAVWSL